MTQKEALKILKTGNSVFLTGAAGSGKTHVLNQYIDYLKEHNIGVAVTASTGIAATHMNGQTIHSWSGIGIRETVTDKDLEKILKKRGVKKRINKTHVLVIDEVSMLHDYQLDMVDNILRTVKGVDEPFGGIQVVLCGDFFQLPPVARGGVARFVVESDAWNSLNPIICYLQEQHRHKDENIKSVLNSIRTNGSIERMKSILSSRLNVDLSEDDDKITKLYTHNVDVDNINKKRLHNLNSPVKKFIARTEGNKRAVASLLKSCLVPEELQLKEGASVMFVKNNFEEGYVNGTLGTIVDFNDLGYPVVETFSGETIEVGFEKWVIEEEGKIRATLRHIPLRLAWAITIHKSQGMSLDAAEMDLSRTFEKGMGYVALSRVRSIDGIKLLGLNDLALKVRDDVLEMDAVFMKKSNDVLEMLQSMPNDHMDKKHDDFLESVPSNARSTNGASKKETTYDKTKKLLNEKKSISDIADERGLNEGTIISHVEKLIQKGAGDLNINHLMPERADLLRIKKAFKKVDDKKGKLTPVYKHLKGNVSYEDLRLARIFLNK